MDTNDTTSPTTDIVIDADSELVEAESFGKEVTKTLIVSTATSAGVFGGFVVIALLTPKVQTWLQKRKKTDTLEEEIVADAAKTPHPKKD